MSTEYFRVIKKKQTVDKLGAGAPTLGMAEIPETSAGKDNDGFNDDVIDEFDDDVIDEFDGDVIDKEEEEHNTYF